MTQGELLWGSLAAQTLIFAVWTVVMFTTLFRLRRNAMSRSGTPFPGPRTTIATFAAFLRDPTEARARRRLGLLTLAMFVAIAFHALVAVPLSAPAGLSAPASTP